MAGHGIHLTTEERAALARALVEPGRTATAVGREMGVNDTTARRMRRRLMEAGLPIVLAEIAAGEEPVAPEPQAAPAPVERHDAAFWKRKHDALARETGEIHALVRELGVIDGLKIGVPSWAALPAEARTSRAVGIMHTSDWHIGERVAPQEINAWNRYDIETARARAMRYTDSAIQKLKEWSVSTTLDGVLYTMAGDEISGDIHEELRQTNEVTSMEQVQVAVGLRVASLRRVADAFGRVHVVAVPGNHGRTTPKPTAKKYAALSYDILIARLVTKEMEGDDRFTFEIADGTDVLVEIYGRNVLVLHGDKIGTGGGQGFAGPELPILRGVHKTRAQYASVGIKIDLVLGGHFHTSANLRGALFNGSLVGYSEYAQAIRAPLDVPKQWVAMYRARWGLSEQLAVQLEALPKPRVRIMPATSVAAE